jgi:hypothetical protein
MITIWRYKGTAQKIVSRLKGAGRNGQVWPGGIIDRHGIGYGCDWGAMDCWKAVNAEGYHYAFADGPYWLRSKPSHVRAAWNAYQYRAGTGVDRSGGKLLKQSGAVMKDFRHKRGDAVYLCPSHPMIHRNVYGHKGGAEEWIERTRDEVKKHTDRPVKVRQKGDAGVSALDIEPREISMETCFGDAWAIVVAGSTIGVEAVCRGIPVFATESCAAADMASSDLSHLERPFFPDEGQRRVWAENLAARQWNVDQLSNGKAWRVLIGDVQILEAADLAAATHFAAATRDMAAEVGSVDGGVASGAGGGVPAPESAARAGTDAGA